MDVKMSFDKYEIVTGVKANNNILESINIIKNSKKNKQNKRYN